MATATFHKYLQFVEDLAKKVHNLNSDTLKLALTNVAPNDVTHTVLADVTELGAGSGYSAGGPTAAFVSGVQTAGVYKLILADAAILAAGGTIGPFRYVVLYNSTPATKPLIGWWDYNDINPATPNVTLADGESFLADLSASLGAITIT